MILTLTGASGAGKSTLARALVRLLPSARLSPGCTTRPVRETETQEDVRRLSEKEFAAMRESGDFLWAVEVHGYWYGTLRRVVAAGLSDHEHWLLLVLTPSVLPILKRFAIQSGQGEAVRSVYVLAPEQAILRRRLSEREVEAEVIDRRLVDCVTWDRTARSSDLCDFFVPGEGDVDQHAWRLISQLPTREVE